MPIDIRDLIPGGLRPDDHIHRTRNDNTCSRCRKPVPEDQVPLLIWISRDDLLICCGACLDGEDGDES